MTHVTLKGRNSECLAQVKPDEIVLYSERWNYTER
jgi:hypothetical protein